MKTLGTISIALLAGVILLVTLPNTVLFDADTARPQNEAIRGGLDTFEYVSKTEPEQQAMSDDSAIVLKQSIARSGNAQQWLSNFWQSCQGLSACLQYLQAIEHQFQSSEFEQLTEWLIAYDQYLIEMTSLTLSTELSGHERFAAVKALREKHFDAGTTDVFGVEHRFVALQNNLDEFWRSVPKSEDTEITLSRLLTWQQDAVARLGQYSGELMSADTLYQQALPLLTELPSTEKQAWNRKLLQHYFPNQWQAIEEWQVQQSQQQIAQAHYQLKKHQLVEEWQALKSQMPVADWQLGFERAMNDLRHAHFEASAN